MTPYVKAGVLVLLLLGSGCERKDSPPPSGPKLGMQYRQGEISVVLSVSETNITTTGSIRLVLDVHAPEGVNVAMPEMESLVEPFAVWDSHAESPQALSGRKLLHRQVWRLVPGLPGDVVFPSLQIVAGTAAIKTEPFAVHVESILPPGLETFEIKDIAAPATLLPGQEQRRRLWLMILTALAIGVVAGAFLRLYLKTKRVSALPPHEAAFLALEKIEAQKPDAVPFIHELNRILREYLNARFNLPALESTSTELMPLLDNPELIRFLADCDDIKFAHVVPSGFVSAASDFVRSYIAATTPMEDQ